MSSSIIYSPSPSLIFWSLKWNSINCWMKPWFGFIIERPCRQIFKADDSVIWYSIIRYAQIHDVLREMPAQQWTNTVPPFWIECLMNMAASIKCHPRFSQGTSLTYNTLYLNFRGKDGLTPPNACKICVMPFSLSIASFYAALISPRYKLSIILLIGPDFTIIFNCLQILIYFIIFKF